MTVCNAISKYGGFFLLCFIYYLLLHVFILLSFSVSFYFIPYIQSLLTLFILFFYSHIYLYSLVLTPRLQLKLISPFHVLFHSSVILRICQHIYHCPSSPIYLFVVDSNAVGCTESLGMKSRLISDNQLSASSAYRTWGIDAFTWLPHYARLDKQGKTNAWSPANNNRSEWLQVTCASFNYLSSH